MPTASFERIGADSAFTRLTDGWAEWLLELRRLLTDDGVLVVGLAPRERFERLTGHPWDDDRIGMTVLSALNGPGRRASSSTPSGGSARTGAAPSSSLSIEEDGGRSSVSLRAAGRRDLRR